MADNKEKTVKKTKKCRACREEIDYLAKVCPLCREKQGTFSQRHPILLIFLVVLWLFLFVGIYLALSEYEIIDGNIVNNNIKTSEEVKQDFISSCTFYNYTDISRNPNNYKGRNAKFTGKVIQVQDVVFDNIIMLVDVNQKEYGLWDDTVYVTYKYRENESRILKDDIITMYGKIKGLKSYTTVLGAKVTIPELELKYYTMNK